MTAGIAERPSMYLYELQGERVNDKLNTVFQSAEWLQERVNDKLNTVFQSAEWLQGLLPGLACTCMNYKNELMTNSTQCSNQLNDCRDCCKA